MNKNRLGSETSTLLRENQLNCCENSRQGDDDDDDGDDDNDIRIVEWLVFLKKFFLMP
jgi:hypothetical protein